MKNGTGGSADSTTTTEGTPSNQAATSTPAAQGAGAVSSPGTEKVELPAVGVVVVTREAPAQSFADRVVNWFLEPL